MYNKYQGKIFFEPPNKTRKHELQSDWKKIAMVLFDGDITEYYAWFILKRYNLVLNKPLRGAHLSFLNDSVLDIKTGSKVDDIEELWANVKNNWNDKNIEIEFSPDVRTDGKHWWLTLSEESKIFLQSIRNELGLSKPFWTFHLTIGYANDINIYHSEYIHNLIKKFGNEYN